MVGHASAAKLELLGIKTIGDLAKMDPALIEAHLKSHGRTIWEYANGIESVHIDERTKTDMKNSLLRNKWDGTGRMVESNLRKPMEIK